MNILSLHGADLPPYFTLVTVFSRPAWNTRAVIKPNAIYTGTTMLARESLAVVFV